MKIKKIISLALAAVAMVASTSASMGCLWVMIDEPSAPKSLQD